MGLFSVLATYLSSNCSTPTSVLVRNVTSCSLIASRQDFRNCTIYPSGNNYQGDGVYSYTKSDCVGTDSFSAAVSAIAPDVGFYSTNTFTDNTCSTPLTADYINFKVLNQCLKLNNYTSSIEVLNHGSIIAGTFHGPSCSSTPISLVSKDVKSCVYDQTLNLGLSTQVSHFQTIEVFNAVGGPTVPIPLAEGPSLMPIVANAGDSKSMYTVSTAFHDPQCLFPISSQVQAVSDCPSPPLNDFRNCTVEPDLSNTQNDGVYYYTRSDCVSSTSTQDAVNQVEPSNALEVIRFYNDSNCNSIILGVTEAFTHVDFACHKSNNFSSYSPKVISGYVLTDIYGGQVCSNTPQKQAYAAIDECVYQSTLNYGTPDEYSIFIKYLLYEGKSSSAESTPSPTATPTPNSDVKMKSSPIYVSILIAIFLI